MAKLGFYLCIFASIPASAAWAQDFGTEWIDRVTRIQQQERGPLPPRPVDWSVSAGAAYYHDDNVFLTERDEIDSGVVIPFVRGRLTYAETRFDVEADVLANYKAYTADDRELRHADDDEQRLYFRARQTTGKWNFEVSEIFQRVSDPLDLIFIDRAERIVSNTIPRMAVDMGKLWSFEAGANIQVVRFEDDPMRDGMNNNNVRADATMVYKTPWGWDVLGQVGYQHISYIEAQTKGAPPDAWGWYYRGGIRGELSSRFSIDAVAGYARMESDFYQGTKVDEQHATADAAVSLRYEATERVSASADYTRQFAFVGLGDPFQVVNRFGGLIEFKVMEELTFRARGQYDYTSSINGVRREFVSASGGLTWTPSAYLALEGGVTWRTGEVELDDAETEFDNVIFHAGLALTY